MIKVKEAIIVEGKYDKIKLSQFIEGTIIPTNGFRVFKDHNILAMIQNITKKSGAIILMDNDSAGFMIRNFLKANIREGTVYHAYIPDIYGKEKRKKKASKEGKLGVEGISCEVLIECLSRAKIDIGKTGSDLSDKKDRITKLDLYLTGISGRENSKSKRKILLNYLELPENLSHNLLLDVLNTYFTRKEYCNLIKNIIK